MTHRGADAPTRSSADARRWMREGTTLFLTGVADLDEAGLAASTDLPSWSRRHLVAHVAANADALGNLVQWAATGDPTPMYASPEDRARGIEEGTRRTTPDLLAWVRSSAETLADAMARLTDTQWEQPVVTAQGRTVPATETPWMRAREVCVHAVDLGTGVTFADLPLDFLAALATDIVTKRNTSPSVSIRLDATDSPESWELSGEGEPATVSAPLADLVAYLSGRTATLSTNDGSPAPVLPAWL